MAVTIKMRNLIKNLINLIILPVAFIVSSVAIAKPDDISVPFQNIELPMSSRIGAVYSFGNHPNQVMMCKADIATDVPIRIRYTYKGTQYALNLPVQLKDDEKLEGVPIDTKGRIIINTPFSTEENNSRVLISCHYVTAA